MAFREKVAWISLLGIAVFAAYVGMRVATEPGLMVDRGQFVGLIVAAAILQGVVTIAATVMVAVASRRDARARRDERDKLIDLKAARIAYVVLFVGMIGIAWAYLAGTSGFVVPLAALGAVSAAECVRFAGQIVQYRFGA